MSSNFRNYLNTYVFETDLPGSGQSVSFKPVTTGQIKRLLLYETTNDPLSIEVALDNLIEECVVKPENFKVSGLYIQDRFFLLVEIRKATRGATYMFQTECASCGSQTQQSINLSELPVTKLITTKKVETKKQPIPTTGKHKKIKLIEKTEDTDETTQENNVESMDWDVVKLNDKISVRLTLVTREIQQKAFDIFSEKHKDNIDGINDIQKAFDITTSLYALCMKSIITPEGEETDLPLEEKIFLLDNIQQSEHDKISKWFDINDFGIDFSFDIKCSHCGYTEKKAVPVENFFY